MATNKIRLGDLFRYYKALPHQLAALTELEQAINKANPNTPMHRSNVIDVGIFDKLAVT